MSPGVVQALQSMNGPNIVTTNVPNEEWNRFLRCMFDWFNCFLWMASILCFSSYYVEIWTSDERVVPDDVRITMMIVLVTLSWQR